MKRYKIFLVYLVVFSWALAIVYSAAFYLQLGVPTENTRYLAEWIDKKVNYAHSIQDKKLIIVSGSNTLFGIDAERIEKECKIPTVNMGTHGGLGLKYILNHAKSLINDGDIVLLPLEYDFYVNAESFSGEFLDYVISRDPDYFRNKDLREKLLFIYSTDPLHILHGLKARLFPDGRNMRNPYDSKYLNRNGDMTNNNYENKLDDEILLRRAANSPFQGEKGMSEESARVLAEFIAFCREKNSIVLAAYPSYLHANKQFASDDLKTLAQIREFYDAHGAPVLGRYDDYEADDFYDTRYHLNSAGKEKRTARLIHELKEYVK